MSIAQLQPIAVIFTEPQEYVDRINQELARQGSPEVTVTNAEGQKLATGKLTISDNQVDVATGTIRLKAEFENTDNSLWPGLAVTTELTLGVEKDALIVPAEAVQHGQNGLFVYVVDNQNRAEVRPVKVAQQNATTAVISDGLKEGERVVTAGQLLLQPGAQVAIDVGQRELRRDVRRHIGPLHPSPCRYDAVDGRHPAGRPRRLPVASRCAAPAGRFSDDHGFGSAARRVPGYHGHLRRAAARAADRADSRRLANDLDERARRNRGHRAVRSQPQHRRRRQ